VRYLRLLGVFYKYSLLGELEYRVDLIANVVMSVFWLAWAVIGVTVFFMYADKMGDWSYPEVLMVVALFTLFNGLMEAFLRPNIGSVIDQIRDGTFDFVRLKPVNVQFLASFRNIVVWHLIDVVIGIGLIAYALAQLRIVPSPAQIALFVLMLLTAMIIVYTLWLTIASLAFWFVRLDNITELFYGFYEAGRYPVTIYRGIVRAFLTFVVPVAFVTTFPASALLGRLDQATVLIGVTFGIVSFLLASRFWRFALRHYSSASS
jgi:ABC-2 type transport system permease protein